MLASVGKPMFEIWMMICASISLWISLYISLYTDMHIYIFNKLYLESVELLESLQIQFTDTYMYMRQQASSCQVIVTPVFL